MSGSEYDENENKAYVKKELIAQPYKSPFETEKDIEKLIVKNTR